ncbi:hypothetical protein NHX12_013511 [Muraenolepis orangiensis]|uniref:C2 domain-containing protein n=1 Tax=Muraenolepis orangiensis TaxID=630683 RepID=A0A9Q0DEZ9_9TELE|nr:hypothetical protein NHX12_013511 [Muraenolepis orangiensis]
MSFADAGPTVTGKGAAHSALPEDMQSPRPPGEGLQPPGPPGEGLQPPRPPGERAVTVLWSFGKCLGTLLPVYLAGYCGFSIMLVLFALMVYMGWKHSRLEKVWRLRSAMYLLENERQFSTGDVLRTKRDLPPWILQQAWPFVGQYLEKLLLDTVAPAIRASSIHLQTLSFTKINLGDKALKVMGVKAHTEHDKRQVMLDLYVSYAGDVEINVEIKKYFCKAGVKGIQLYGKLRVILEPLIGDIPLVGAITMFFIRKPVTSHLVLPNRLTIPLVADLHVAQLRSPLPRGVVRIHLLEAEDLTSMDTVIKGFIDGKSDPYAVLRVGTQTFTSRHVIVHEVPGQELEVEVFDKDPDQDDFLGRVKVDLDIVKKARVVDDWFNLKDVPSGSVHLRLEWLSLLPSAARLSEVIQRNQNLTSKTSDPPSAAILAVYLDQAHALPTCHGTNNPVWEDAFTFFIPDPRKEDIDIQVKDDDRALALGSLSIPLARLLDSPNLTLDQWFQLENSGSASRIYIKTILRVLWLNEEAVATTPSSPRSAPGAGPFPGGISSELGPPGLGGSKPQSAWPQNTAPDPEFGTEGVLRIHLAEAQNLIAKDNFMGGMVKGKSDPYVKIKVAGVTYRSHTIKENLNPVWNELYEVILTQLPGQEIQFELFDKDIDQDDFLGRFKLNLRDIISAQFIDTWYTLNDVKSGRVHLLLEWLPRVTEISRLEQVCERSTSPRWDEACHFLVRDPREETLTVRLSHSWGMALGSVAIPLREVLVQPDLVLDRWIHLEGALPESQILLRATLKLLDTQLAVSPDDVTGDEGEHVIPKWDPAHLDLRHRGAFTGINEQGLVAGQVKLTIAYSLEESRLYITVHSCRALASCSKDGADPYVSLVLLPDKKGASKRKTATKKRDLNPEFNERFDFDLSLEESTQRRLDLSVKNYVSFMSRERDLIGKVSCSRKNYVLD